MFTGIITDIGQILEIAKDGDWTFVFACRHEPESIDIGASIACSGCCLTVIERGMRGDNTFFTATVSAETLSKTVLGRWQVGQAVNIERSLKAGDELGGHIVSGHVDDVGHAIQAEPELDSMRWRFRAPASIAPFIAPKGSIAVNGVSLTINDVLDQSDGSCDFGVNIIPHTAQHTTFGVLEVGEDVNLEVDPIARYVARYAARIASVPLVNLVAEPRT